MGCVLYELCTLKHAFSADNLLGLVYKIVQDKYEPIPSFYSKELSDLINSLLNKDSALRPSVAQILSMPLVRQKMIDFVQTGGQTLVGDKGIYVKNNPTIIQQAPTTSGRLGEVKVENTDHFLTPKERMLKKREEETQR